MKLSQTTTQQQKILPAQIQYLNFLKLQQHELLQTLREELEENIFLEEDKPAEEEKETDDSAEELTYEDADTYEEQFSLREMGVNDSKIHNEKRDIFSNHERPVNAREDLIEELRALRLSKRQFDIGAYIIHCLDANGYLRIPADDIADHLSFAWQSIIDAGNVEEMIEVVQGCGPAGVAARDLRECLMLQIFRKEKKTRSDVHAYNIVEENFDLLCERDFEGIRKSQNLTEDELRQALRLIKRLNGAPCNMDSATNVFEKKTDTGVDFIISEDEHGKLKGELCQSYIGTIKLNNHVVEDLKALTHKTNKTRTESQKETYLRSKIQSAKWFVDCISQRERSMQMVIDCILQLQEKFFRTHDKQDLVPMVLQDVADRVGLDVSTISRITSTRYADSTHGKIALKDLFTFGIQASNGSFVSNINVKEMLAVIVREEDKENPYTDSQISKMLEEKGVKIARRTVLKYRDELNLPPAKLRVLKAA